MQFSKWLCGGVPLPQIAHLNEGSQGTFARLQEEGEGQTRLLRGTNCERWRRNVIETRDVVRVAAEANEQSCNASGSTNRVLEEYYRCPPTPEVFGDSRSRCEQPGYFRFGGDTICYGTLADSRVLQSPEAELPDALVQVILREFELDLPFDASEVIENLRHERYSACFREEGPIRNGLLRRAYYLIRPVLGVSARRNLQKWHLRGWRDIRFPSWPVDTTIERVHRNLLALAMRAQGVRRVPFIWFWPGGHSSCAILTHDVETALGKNFCRQLMDLDQSLGFRSSFQVVPESKYSLSDELTASIVDRGFELNIHDLNHDGLLYAERAEFLRRAKRINKYAAEFGARGFRSGLLYRNADWYDALDFAYDMSIPNVAHLDPQRGGCCTVMPYFIGNMVELPLTTTQDYTLFHILGDYDIELWRSQIALIEAEHGVISFLVHPDYVIETRARNAYCALLKHLCELRSEDGLWFALPGEVTQWWIDRSRMRLTCEAGNWRVQGAGSERARVAYAELNGDEVTYRLAS
jgi:hypothetical protein